MLSPTQKLFEIETRDGATHLIRCMIKGVLIEVNERVFGDDLSCFEKDPESTGYLFVASCALDESPFTKESLQQFTIVDG